MTDRIAEGAGQGAAIEARGLTVEWAGSETPALRGVDLTMAAGERVGLLGPSGSGKSTLTLALGGLISPSASISGELRVFGTEVGRASGAELRRLRAGRIGWVFQNPHAALNPVRRIGDHFAETLAVAGVTAEAGRADAERLLRESGLEEASGILAARPHELSGGMAQRVAIALALIGDPDLLVADEPTSALDTVTQRGILDLLARLAADRDLTLLFVSHDLAVVREICDRAVILDEGRVLYDGPIDGVRPEAAEPAVAQLARAAARFTLPADGSRTGEVEP